MPVTRIPNAEDPFGARHHTVFLNTWHAFPLHPPSSTTVGCWRRKGVGITTATATATAAATATVATMTTATVCQLSPPGSHRICGGTRGA